LVLAKDKVAQCVCCPTWISVL